MKTRNVFVLALMSILALGACNNENDLVGNSWETDPLAVHIEASIGNSLFGRSNPLGDDTAQATFSEGDKVVVAAGSQQCVYTLTGGTWIPEDGKYLRWESEAMKFNAYTVLNGANAEGFVLPANQSTETSLATADYMTCAVSATKPNTVSLVMERQTAKIVIKILELKGVKSIESLTIYGNSVIQNTKGKDGAIGSSTGCIPAPFDPYKVTPSPAAVKGTTYTALVAPNTIAFSDSYFVLIRVDGNRKFIYKGMPAVEAGKTYTFNLSVGE